MVSGEIGDMTGGKGCGALVARRQWRGPEHSRRLPPLPSAPMFNLPKRWTTKNDEKKTLAKVELLLGQKVRPGGAIF